MSTFGSFEDFWAASSLFFDRLKRDAQIASNHEKIAHDKALIAALREAQQATNQQMQATDAHLDCVASMVAAVAETVAKRSDEIQSHERRLGWLEGHSE